jgi:hypothetical protein
VRGISTAGTQIRYPTTLARKLLKKLENKRVFDRKRAKSKSTVCQWVPDSASDVKRVLNRMAGCPDVYLEQTPSGAVYLTGLPNPTGIIPYS